MNKSDLIDHIARQAKIPKLAATRALDAMLGYVKTLPNEKPAPKKKTKAVVKAAASRVGAKVKVTAVKAVKAVKAAKFRAGKALKDSVN